jgi:multidrug efflux system outer membrane protein
MTKRVLSILTLAAASFAAGCSMLEPKLPSADAAIPAEWPLPPITTPTPAASIAEGAAVADIGWRDFFVDPDLEELIARALANNRDLRVAVL